MKEKILFVQLPLLDHGYNYVPGNIPSGPASMMAFLRKYHHEHGSSECLPWVIANFASNEIIIDYIIAIDPGIICLTSYLWNVERNVLIATGVKMKNRNIKIIFGGPEIHEESWVVSEYRQAIDIFVSGEGEWFLDRYYGDNDLAPFTQFVNQNALVVQPYGQNVSIARLVEPLTKRYLDPMPDGSTFLEMVRGCPYKCAYCFYSKNCKGIREHPFSILSDAIRMKEWMDLQEIYILAPTFNRTKSFNSKLRTLAAMKHDVRLHTEIRTDGICFSDASLMYSAGFRSLEVGLQTLNEKALKLINRNSDTKAEVDGILNLKLSGIDVKIGMIAGLPGDSKEELCNSIARLQDIGLGENIELYYLSLLPGTKIREMAAMSKVRYLDKPPYYFIEGWNFSFQEIKEVINLCDSVRGFTNVIETIPDFYVENTGLLIGRICLDAGCCDSWNIENIVKSIQTSVFDVHIRNGNIRNIKRLSRILFTALPKAHQLYNIIIYLNELLDERYFSETLAETEADSIYRRMRMYQDWREGTTIRIYQVTNYTCIYDKLLKSYTVITPILQVNSNSAHSLKTLIESYGADEIYVLIEEGSFTLLKETIIREFGNMPERVAFEIESEREEFYNSVGYEYNKSPFSFASVRM